jgi:RNA polymerase sigma-70 factor (ECF subfamily)
MMRELVPNNGREYPSAASLSGSQLPRLQAHEPQAWQRLVALFGPTVYGWCRGRGLSPEDAQEIGQEVFLAVSRTIVDFHINKPNDTFRGWLHTITLHKISDKQDKDRRQPKAEGGSTAQEKNQQLPAPVDPDSSVAPPCAEVQGLHQRALKLMQDEFHERTWRAFLLVAVEGRAPADVAAELGMSLGAVYIAKSRVKNRLREILGGQFP